MVSTPTPLSIVASHLVPICPPPHLLSSKLPFSLFPYPSQPPFSLTGNVRKKPLTKLVNSNKLRETKKYFPFPATASSRNTYVEHGINQTLWKRIVSRVGRTSRLSQGYIFIWPELKIIFHRVYIHSSGSPGSQGRPAGYLLRQLCLSRQTAPLTHSPRPLPRPPPTHSHTHTHHPFSHISSPNQPTSTALPYLLPPLTCSTFTHCLLPHSLTPFLVLYLHHSSCSSAATLPY